MDTLQLLVKGAVVVFVVSSMLSIGLAARGAEIVAPLRSPVWAPPRADCQLRVGAVEGLSIAAVLPIDHGMRWDCCCSASPRARRCCPSLPKPAVPTWRTRRP